MLIKYFPNWIPQEHILWILILKVQGTSTENSQNTFSLRNKKIYLELWDKQGSFQTPDIVGDRVLVFHNQFENSHLIIGL